MKTTGIVRRTDPLGRVVIPIEIRREMGIEQNDALEIFKMCIRDSMETLYLVNIPGMAESILEAAKEPLDEGTDMEDLDWDV